MVAGGLLLLYDCLEFSKLILCGSVEQFILELLEQFVT